jgi:hypothetical protein
MGFLFKFIVIVFGLLYLMGFLFRWFLKRFIRQVQQSASNQTNHQQYRQTPEGKIRIDYVPPRKKPGLFKGGEYVDYEEIK